MISSKLLEDLKKNRFKLEHDANSLINFLKALFLSNEDQSLKLYHLLLHGKMVMPDDITEEEQAEDMHTSAKIIEVACQYAGAKALLDILDTEDM